MDRDTGDYPTGFTVPMGWHDVGQGRVMADLSLGAPVPKGDDHRATDTSPGPDSRTGKATSSLVLRPASDATATLTAHVSELTLGSGR